MQIENMSANTFVSGILCGRLAKHELTTVQNYVDQVSREEINNYINTSNYEHGKTYILTSHGVNFIGIPDMENETEIVKIKTGNPKQYHKLQSAYYSYLSDKKAVILYTKTGLWLDVHLKIDDSDLLEAIENIKSGIAKKNEKCKYCPVKNDCPEFVEDADFIAERIIETKITINRLSEEIERIEKETRLDQLKSDLANLKKEDAYLQGVLRSYDPKKYKSNKGTVLIYEKKFKQLPENYRELRPYEKYKHLYDEPKPHVNDMKKEIGVELKTKAVKIEIHD